MSRSVSAVSMARSEYCRCPPRLPTPTASQVAIASGANHTVISPRWTSARSYAGQFPTWYFVLYFGCTLDFMSRSCTCCRHDGQEVDRGSPRARDPCTNATENPSRVLTFLLAAFVFSGLSSIQLHIFPSGKGHRRCRAFRSGTPGFPFCLPRMAPYTPEGPPSARNSCRRTFVQLQRPSPQPALTCDRLAPLLSGHFSDTAPHVCRFFARRASLHSARASACRRR